MRRKAWVGVVSPRDADRVAPPSAPLPALRPFGAGLAPMPAPRGVL